MMIWVIGGSTGAMRLLVESFDPIANLGERTRPKL